MIGLKLPSTPPQSSSILIRLLLVVVLGFLLNKKMIMRATKALATLHIY